VKGAQAIAVVREVQERTEKLIRDLKLESERLHALADAVAADSGQLDQLAQAASELVNGGDELQGKLAARDSALSILSADLSAKEERAGASQRRLEQLETQVAGLRQENDSLAERCTSLERQAASLARLYTALYQLHGTLEHAQVVERIQEIVTGFLGSEELALLEIDDQEEVQVTAAMGVDPHTLAWLTAARGEVGAALGRGRPKGPEAAPEHPPLTACVPLMVGPRHVGALVVFRLLPQKEALGQFDRDLLEMLASQAARALYFARLHRQARA